MSIRDMQFVTVEQVHRLREAAGKLEDEFRRVNQLAFQTLEMYGVPEERARSIHNGIQVLAARYDKQVADLQAELVDVEHNLRKKIAAALEDDHQFPAAQLVMQVKINKEAA